MRKAKLHYIIPIIAIMIILIISITYWMFHYNQPGVKLTKAEKDYIEANKETIFFMGYYNTPSEKLFVEKLCKKISKDTSLRVIPFEDSWEHTILLLKSGNLSMVANMSISDERMEYASFTESFMPLLAGIYSHYNNPIDSYTKLYGKQIGLDKNNIFGVLFKEKYPDLNIDLKYYDNLLEVKEGLAKGEIDGYLSSKSYTDNQLYNHFFNIQSLTDENNHIGVNKTYKELYSIISKEVDYLIACEWDIETQMVINFELERKSLDFSAEEKGYISSTERIVVGIPSNNSLYLNGTEVYQGGVIPELFDKISFITDLEIRFIVDDFNNLINRDDIDVVISHEALGLPATAPLFSTELITVSRDNIEIINEIYELEPYKVSMIQHDSFMYTLTNKMPDIDIDIAKDYNEIYNLLVTNQVDYGIIPSAIERKYATNPNMRIGAVVGEQHHYMYLINGHHTKLLNIINKCIPVIDVDKIVFEEIDEEIIGFQNRVRFIVVIIVSLIAFVSFIRYIIALVKKYYKVLYVDCATGIYNSSWLQRKLKGHLNEYTYFMIEPCDLEGFSLRYGENAYKTAIKYLIITVKTYLQREEYMIAFSKERFIIAKKVMSDDNRLRFLDNLATLFNSKFNCFDINYSYNINVSSYKYDEFNISLDEIIKSLELGLKYSIEINAPVDYTQDIFMKYYKRREYDDRLTACILNEAVEIEYQKIYDANDEIYGYDILYRCNLGDFGTISGENLLGQATRLNLQVSLQKMIIKEILNSCEQSIAERSDKINTLIFIALEESILTSKGFFEWVVEKLEKLVNLKLIIKLDNDTYGENIDLIESINSPFIDFAICKFGYDLKNDFMVRDYRIEIVELDQELFVDIEEYEEVIEFILSFCKQSNIKTIVQSINMKSQYEALKKHDIDYIIENRKGQIL